ncbi:hypothetical protein F4808DRAFT_437229 [Astrocystis sublimbata]|nr:hypothetical protein F4808DRAFT_437229 [Astrocystis sublimbata]
MDESSRAGSETMPFINVPCDERPLPSSETCNVVKWWARLSPTTKFLGHLFLVLLYTLLFICFLSGGSGTLMHPNNALKNIRFRWQPTMSITAGASPFAGGPSDAVDKAWSSLMESISIRVTQDELNRNGNHQTSINLPIGGGNLAWLGAFHHLHCLKMIRQINYSHHYFPNQTEGERKDLEVHFMLEIDSRVVSFEEVDSLKNPLL